jgi:hypothetical protein
MTPTDAPFIGWDWDIVRDADLNEFLPPLFYNGAAMNLSGCSVAIYIRPTYEYDTPIAVLTTPPGTSIDIDDAANGLVSVFRSHELVEAWPVGDWRFMVVVTDANGRKAEVARGPFRIHSGDDSS